MARPPPRTAVDWFVGWEGVTGHGASIDWRSSPTGPLGRPMHVRGSVHGGASPVTPRRNDRRPQWCPIRRERVVSTEVSATFAFVSTRPSHPAEHRQGSGQWTGRRVSTPSSERHRCGASQHGPTRSVDVARGHEVISLQNASRALTSSPSIRSSDRLSLLAWRGQGRRAGDRIQRALDGTGHHRSVFTAKRARARWMAGRSSERSRPLRSTGEGELESSGVIDAGKATTRARRPGGARAVSFAGGWVADQISRAVPELLGGTVNAGLVASVPTFDSTDSGTAAGSRGRGRRRCGSS